jgi:hypothetical protein
MHIIPYNKYINGVIYTITSVVNPNLIYIGSTNLDIKQRLFIHKCGYRRYINKIGNYITAYDLFKLGNIKMEMLLKCPCSNRRELDKIEGLIIASRSCINKNVAGGKSKNKDAMRSYFKDYYKQHREDLIKNNLRYYYNNRERCKDRQRRYMENKKTKAI